jgi:hypothetical protein
VSFRQLVRRGSKLAPCDRGPDMLRMSTPQKCLLLWGSRSLVALAHVPVVSLRASSWATRRLLQLCHWLKYLHHAAISYDVMVLFFRYSQKRALPGPRTTWELAITTAGAGLIIMCCRPSSSHTCSLSLGHQCIIVSPTLSASSFPHVTRLERLAVRLRVIR